MSRSIKEIMGLRETQGDLGIEIELETEHEPPYSSLPSGWRAESDGSLRGNSVEYVLSKPKNYEKCCELLDSLKNKIDMSGCRPKFSERAGVHVHVNVQELTVEQVFRFALVYYTLEDVLTNFCGEGRVGNHFCLRVSDAQYPLSLIEDSRTEDNILAFQTDGLRYAGLNFLSLFRYGSLEFRSMESQPDLSKIKDWCQILLRIKEYALSLESRSQIAYDISFHSPSGYLRNILGERLSDVVGYEGMEDDIIESMRLAQMAIFEEPVT